MKDKGEEGNDEMPFLMMVVVVMMMRMNSK
jgi:hypothetical protein